MKRTPSGKCQKTYRTLAIIGNGFDIAHNYATLYRSFVDATSSESLDISSTVCIYFLILQNIAKESQAWKHISITKTQDGELMTKSNLSSRIINS